MNYQKPKIIERHKEITTILKLSDTPYRYNKCIYRRNAHFWSPADINNARYNDAFDHYSDTSMFRFRVISGDFGYGQCTISTNSNGEYLVVNGTTHLEMDFDHLMQWIKDGISKRISESDEYKFN